MINRMAVVVCALAAITRPANAELTDVERDSVVRRACAAGIRAMPVEWFSVDST